MPEAADKLQPFKSLDYIERKETGNQSIGDCIFCGKELKFYINKFDGRWDCKVCGKSGNIVTFLSEVFDLYHQENFATAPWQELSEDRNIETKVLQSSDLIWDGSRWLLAYRGSKGKIVSYKEYDKNKSNKLWALSGIPTGLYGLEVLSNSGAKQKRVYVCESEWDAIALRPYIDSEKELIVAQPSANVFKNEWANYFANKDIILCFDNDKAGRAGTKRTANLLKDTADSTYYINWPSWAKDGYDLRDYLCIDKRPYDELLQNIERYISEEEGNRKATKSWQGVPPSFEETLQVFKDNYEINPTIEAAIRVAFATYFSVDIEGDPLWVFLVGPPGSMKTEIIKSMRDCSKAYYLSSCTPTSLVSGANVNPDPSILRKANGKCLMFKDWTEVLTKSKDESLAIESIFRGAYDGTVEREYGLGKVNRFDTQFSFLSGVTPAIRNSNSSEMGQRSLLFNVYEGRGNSDRRMVEAAYRGGGIEKEVREKVQNAVTEYIERTDIHISKIPSDYGNEIVALSMMVARLRAKVMRDTREVDRVTVLPYHEIATRICKELKKLALALALHEPFKEVNARVMSIVRKAARDTCNELHLRIMYAMTKIDYPEIKTNIIKSSGLPMTTAMRVMEDMSYQGVIEKNASKVKGEAPAYKLTSDSIEWAKAAGLYGGSNGHKPAEITKSAKPRWILKGKTERRILPDSSRSNRKITIRRKIS